MFNYLQDFFQILLNPEETKDIINLYFWDKINRKITYDLNVDKLVQYINESHCIQNNFCDFSVLYNYIDSKENIICNKNTPIKKEFKPKKHRKNKKKKKSVESGSEGHNKNEEIKKDDSEDIKIESNSIVQGKSSDLESVKNQDNIIIENNNSLNNHIQSIPDDNENRNEEEEKEFLDNEEKVNDKEKNTLFNIQTKENIIDNYFRKKKEFYSKKRTPILDAIINKKIKIEEDIFVMEKLSQSWIFEPYYKNIFYVVEAFNNEEIFQQKVLEDKIIGYICFSKNKKDYEGIFSILPSSILYDEITNKTKYKKDNIYESSSEISANCFKARGLSIEYYINNLLKDIFHLEELPKTIYYFNNISDILDNPNKISEENDNKKNKMKWKNWLVFSILRKKKKYMLKISFYY